MRRLLAVFALVIAGSIGNAQAAVITFEDVAVPPNTQVNAGDISSGGFFFNTFLDHSHIDNGTWGTSNGSTALLIDIGGNATTISPLSGGAFALTSIDISEAGNNGITARRIEVTGVLSGGGTVVTVLDLDDNIVDAVTANYFQTFAFDASWTNLTSVTLNGVGATCCGNPAGNYFEIDNLVVTAAPEPGMLSLIGLGSAYLFGRRRTRR